MADLYLLLETEITKDITKKYAVFDFDHTCISNDIQELIYIYQAENFCYNISVEEFKSILRISNEVKSIAPEIYDSVRNIEDETINLYSELFKEGIKTNKSRDYCFFRGMLSLLEIANVYCNHHFTYQWILKFLLGFSIVEINNLSSQVYKKHLMLAKHLVLEQNEALTNIGLNTTLYEGAQINQNIFKLMKFLSNHGVDIYIVSASSHEAILGVVNVSEFNELIDKDKIIAQHIHKEIIDEILPIDEGKEEIIRKELFQRYGNRNPILVAGDSMGDYWMFNMLGRDGIRVVVGNNQNLKLRLKAEKLSYHRMAYTD